MFSGRRSAWKSDGAIALRNGGFWETERRGDKEHNNVEWHSLFIIMDKSIEAIDINRQRKLTHTMDHNHSHMLSE